MVSEVWKKDMVEQPKLSVYIQSMHLVTGSAPCVLQECVNAIKGRNRYEEIYEFAGSVPPVM